MKDLIDLYERMWDTLGDLMVLGLVLTFFVILAVGGIVGFFMFNSWLWSL